MGSQGTAVKPSSKLSTSSSAVKSSGKSSGKRQVIDESTGKPRGTGDIKRNPKPKDPSPVPKTTPEAKITFTPKPSTGDTVIKNARDTIEKLDAERIANEEAAKKKLADEAAAAQAAAEAEQTTLLERQTARGRQRAKQIGDYGRSDTILTSPLGLPGNSGSRSKKTLLGM